MQLEKEQQEKAIQPISKIPPLPPWPTSKPGPEATPPSPGERPMPTRTDQMVEVAYDMETGISSSRAPTYATPDDRIPGASPSPQQAEAVEEKRRGERHKKAKR